MFKTETRLFVQLGITQTIGYASSYYLSAILARPIAADLGFEFEQYFLFVAAASIIGGLLGPVLGRQIDRFGGRVVLPASSVLFALGLTLMSLSQDPVSFAASWIITGVAMAAGLYDAAFATVVEVLGEQSRKTIAGITLIAGFASTIGWPITAAIAGLFSWREAILFWAITHVLITLPLHLLMPANRKHERRARREVRSADKDKANPIPRTLVVLTALLFFAGGAVQSALGAHLPQLMELAGANQELALLAATLLGPGQVVARLLQVLFTKTFTPQRVAFLALVLHPVGALFLFLETDVAPLVFSFLHGMGSGYLTVAAGVLPLYLFGSKNYGERQGYIMAASKILLSFAPVALGFFMVRIGIWSLALTSLSAVIALAILFFLLAHHNKFHKLSQ